MISETQDLGRFCMEWRNEEFDLGGVSDLALVCFKLERTVESCTRMLGKGLIKTAAERTGVGV